MIGITTYCQNKERLEIIKKSFDSLIKTTRLDKIIVVDDCSPDKSAVEYIRGLGIEVIERKENKGLAKNKNVLIKCILDKGYDIGFLADDDNIYEEGREEQYVEAINKTQISHFSLRLSLITLDNSKQKSGDEVEKNGYKYRITPACNGCFVTFTRDMIYKIGYYPELPHKLGHEHSIRTQKAIHNGFASGYSDVIDPKIQNLQIIDESYTVSTDEAYIYKNLIENGKHFNKDYNLYQSYHD